MIFIIVSDLFAWKREHSKWKMFLNIWNDKRDPQSENLETVYAVPQ